MILLYHLKLTNFIFNFNKLKDFYLSVYENSTPQGGSFIAFAYFCTLFGVQDIECSFIAIEGGLKKFLFALFHACQESA